MKWNIDIEPSEEARRFRQICPYDMKWLRYAALVVAAITIGLDLYEFDWQFQAESEDVRTTTQGTIDVMSPGGARKQVQPAESPSGFRAKTSK